MKQTYNQNSDFHPYQIMLNGFTLIELLAVIVILAVIALIVTPVVTGIITSAKESANARSVEGHIKNVEYAITSSAFVVVVN